MLTGGILVGSAGTILTGIDVQGDEQIVVERDQWCIQRFGPKLKIN
jgi:hypothetical protein